MLVTSFCILVFSRASRKAFRSSEDFSITFFISFTPLTAFSICLSRYFPPRREISAQRSVN